jgi:hypothetical protein
VSELSTDPQNGRPPLARGSKSTPNWLLGGACALVAVALASQVVSVGMARQRAETRAPASADVQDAKGLAVLADANLAKARSPSELAKVMTLARRSYARAPVEARPLRVLAIAKAQAGRLEDARRIMVRAGGLSGRDGPTNLWLFEDALRRNDVKEAMLRADLAIRIDNRMTEALYPVLVRAAAFPEARPALTARLAKAYWRGSFLEQLAKRSQDPGPVIGVIQDLHVAGVDLRADEIQGVLNQLVARGAYAEAYLLWTDLLPPETLSALGNVYDGDFDGAPGTAPFNWGTRPDIGAVVDQTVGEGGGRVLSTQFYGVPRDVLTSQLLTLPPGGYRLSGRSLIESGDAEDLAWSVRCAEGGAALSKVQPATGRAAWKSFAGGFVVPMDGCSAQWLELRGSASASTRGVSAAWDKISIVRSTDHES